MPNNNERIIELRALGKSWTYIGNALGIDRRTAKKRWEAEEAHRWHPSDEATYYAPRGPRTISEAPRFDTSRFEATVVQGDMLVTSDWHVPLHDPKMVNAVINKAHEESISTLIIGGDYWDMTSYSHYPPHQREAPFEIERETGIEIFDALLDTFDQIYMFWGNHDFRFLRGNDFRMSYVYGMKMLLEPLGDKLDQIEFSELDYMWLDQAKEYRFSHQKNFSKIPLTVPRQLAQKHHCSVITAHSHHCAMGVALDGENVIIEAGGLFDKNITEYVQKTTTHHEWVQGFTMFKNGIPTLFSPAFGNI